MILHAENPEGGDGRAKKRTKKKNAGRGIGAKMEWLNRQLLEKQGQGKGPHSLPFVRIQGGGLQRALSFGKRRPCPIVRLSFVSQVVSHVIVNKSRKCMYCTNILEQMMLFTQPQSHSMYYPLSSTFSHSCSSFFVYASTLISCSLLIFTSSRPSRSIGNRS